jgi:D-glycero-alpha-D-manno-heptose 1-phosphate guanylyltransferase
VVNCRQIKLAIILAGGYGTRLHSVIHDVPKPMAHINSRPFLEYLLDYWIHQGICEFVLSVGYMKGIITEHFRQEYRGAKIIYTVEDEPLGTGGGLLLAAKSIPFKQPFLVLNGDTFFAVPLPDLLNFHDRNSSALTFSLFRTNETKRYLSIGISSEAKVVSFQSGNNDCGEKSFLANGGVYLVESTSVFLSSDFIVGSKVSLEDDIIPTLHRNGTKLFGYECSGDFIDIGIPNDYFCAQTILAKRFKV